MQVPAEPTASCASGATRRVAALADGADRDARARHLGYEWDEDLDNGSRPAGLIAAVETTVTGVAKLLDTAPPTAAGTATHHLTLYRADSERRAWCSGRARSSGRGGSTATTTAAARPPTCACSRRRSTCFADMGVQPATLQPGLDRGERVDRLAAPTSIDRRLRRRRDRSRAAVPLTITGTATDADVSGAVGGVEVSVDGGATWHPAIGRESWSYTWTPATNGHDDHRHARHRRQRQHRVPALRRRHGHRAGSAARDVPVHDLRATTTAPAALAIPEHGGGRARGQVPRDEDGYITGVRFYKRTANTGTHVGHLWTASGTQLADGHLHRRERRRLAAGPLSPPVPVTAGTDVRRLLPHARRLHREQPVLRGRRDRRG